MVRIAEKELVVNYQMKIQLNGIDDVADLFVFDPGWKKEHQDPVTGQMAILYDHVPRHVKISGGIQLWFLVPRYRLEDGSCYFRVLPCNLCSFKHYAVEEIQDEIDRALDEQTTAGEIEGQLRGDNDPEDRPCERTKRLWILWFYKNLLLIESVLRMIRLVQATVQMAGELKIEQILAQADYLGELRAGQPDDWLKIVAQAAWNSGRPLIPLRDTQTMVDVWDWLDIHPISE